jgi:octaprenyl-diphosphate synthase
MLRLANLYDAVADDLTLSDRIFADELISDQAFISDLCRHIQQFHGKRVRPALLLLSAKAAGGIQPAHHVLAAVVEMVHIATLVHDDVLDEADIRRRAATVNRLWGNERAVLMGDFLISHAFHLCSSLESQQASRIIGDATNTVCEGEMMQVVNRENFDLDEGEYLDFIGRKTAALIAACTQLGALFAGASDFVVEQFRRYGYALGVAFQITDDVLDLIGDEAEVGKSLGLDLEKGKLTLPLIHFLRTCSADERAQMIRLARGSASADHAEIARRLAASQSVSYARQMAERYVAEARESLLAVEASEARDCLLAMAEFTLSRKI